MIIKIKKSLIIIILMILHIILFLPLNLVAKEAISLNDSILIGLENNYELLIARIDYQEKKEQHELAQAVADLDLIESYQLALENAEKALLSSVENLIQAIENNYYNILRDKESLLAQKESLERSQVRLEADEIRFKAGELSIVDIRTARDNYAELEKAYKQAVENLEIRKRQFNHLLGRDLNANLKLKSLKELEFDLDLMKIEFEEAYNLALENRKDIKTARKDVLEAKENLEKMDNPFNAPVKIQELRYILVKENIRIKQLETSIYFEIKQNIRDLKEAYHNIGKAEKDLASSIKELKSTKLQYEAGLISIQAMLEAQAEVSTYENNVIQAKWNYKGQRASFKKALGLGSVEHYLEKVEITTISEEIINRYGG